MNLIQFIKCSNRLNEAEELIFFGGSFNPWHPGHTSCIKLLGADKDLIIIPDHNPYKELVDNDIKLTSLKEIKEQLCLLPNRNFIFDGYYQEGKKNPTSTWIKDLFLNFPKKRLSLLMGHDTFLGLDKWINYMELISTLSVVYVASRLDDNVSKQSQVGILKGINPNLNIVFLGNHEHEALSSTKIRNQ